MSKVIFFNSHVTWPSHYETELELMQLHLNQGDEIIQISCNSELSVCDINHEGNILKCIDCIAKRTKALHSLSGHVEEKSISEFLTPEHIELIKSIKFEFNSLQELQKIKFQNFFVGYGVGSSILTITKNTEFDVEKYRELIVSFLQNGIATFLAFNNILEVEQPERVYNFNGRFTMNRAVFRACLDHNIDIFNHERGHDIYHYELYKNHLPQDREEFQRKVKYKWEEAKNSDKIKIAENFYTDRAKGKPQSWYSFTQLQSNDLLPVSWEQNKKNIIIFTSSEFELVSSGDLWKNNLYKKQIFGIEQIIKSLKSNDDIRLYIRLHPNLINADADETQRFLNLKEEGVGVILPDSQIDSYALLKNADKIITFGSSIGLEATYWGKPSILAGPSFYDELDACYQPKSHEELIEMAKRTLLPKEQTGALKYGYFMNTFGIPFQYYKPEDFNFGYFNDINIQEIKPDLLSTATKAIYSLGAPIFSDAIYNFYMHKKLFKKLD